MTNQIQVITDEVYGIRGAFESVLADRSLNFEREAGFAIQAISANDYITKVAYSSPQSVRNAVTNIAAIGISLNPAKKQAYLVPRDGRICLDISYMGLLDLAIASGSIMWGQAELVYSGDRFKRNGFDKPPTHEFEEFSTARGDIVGVYVVVKTRDGDYLTTTMTIDEVNGIRDRSSAWKAYMEKKKSCPWVTDPGEMIKKTVIKRAYKTWPKTDRLDMAIHHLNTDAGEGLDFTPSAAPAPESSALLPAAQAAASRGIDALRKWWDSRSEADRQSLIRDFKALKAAAKKADEERTIDDGGPK